MLAGHVENQDEDVAATDQMLSSHLSWDWHLLYDVAMIQKCALCADMFQADTIESRCGDIHVLGDSVKHDQGSSQCNSLP